MPDQIPLIGPRGGLRPRPARTGASGGSQRVQVLLDSPVRQLDRLLDFTVPQRMASVVRPGVRVKVRLSGRRMDGYVAAMGSSPGYSGPVRPLDGVVSPVPVLSSDVLALCRAVADHYAGTTSDVVRLAVPARAAAVEGDWTEAPARTADAQPGARIPGLPQGWLASAVSGRGRGVWTCPPGRDWAEALAGAAAAVAAAGRGALIVLPDGRDVDRVRSALASEPPDSVAVLRAEDGRSDRYRAFLAVLSGRARIVLGTRAAAFAPVRDLSLAMIWDDGDPSHSEPRAPYPHAREVLTLRSHLSGAALLLAAHSRSCEAQRLVERGWAQDLQDRAELRRSRPRVATTQDRLFSPLDLVRRFPAPAVSAIRSGLRAGPVLIQVSRAGYVPVVACQSCREIARCPHCGGAWEIPAVGEPRCNRCGDSRPFRCPHCGGRELRAVRVGAGRTAEEVGRLFPDQAVHLRTADAAAAAGIGSDPIRSGIVVATPGLEPAAHAGYAAAYLPDAYLDLWRPDVRAAENALRRWCNAAALVRAGAPVLVDADPGEEPVQALVRWDPAGFAARQLTEREAGHLPPAERLVQLDGEPTEVDDIVAALREQVPGLRVLGPRTLDDTAVRALLTAPEGALLVSRARAALRAAGARTVQVRVDPAELD